MAVCDKAEEQLLVAKARLDNLQQARKGRKWSRVTARQFSAKEDRKALAAKEAKEAQKLEMAQASSRCTYQRMKRSGKARAARAPSQSVWCCSGEKLRGKLQLQSTSAKEHIVEPSTRLRRPCGRSGPRGGERQALNEVKMKVLKA